MPQRLLLWVQRSRPRRGRLRRAQGWTLVPQLWLQLWGLRPRPGRRPSLRPPPGLLEGLPPQLVGEQ